MTENLKELMLQVEDCILAGRIQDAAHLLTKVQPRKVPRADCAQVAQLFRRVGAPLEGLRLLYPILHPPLKKQKEPATTQETFEYAVCLQRLGVSGEAVKLLDQVPPEEAPEALLYKTVFRFSEWEFRGGVTQLLKVINLCERNSYLYRSAQLNLASAFIHEERYSEADILLKELQASTSEAGEYILFCNSLELAAKSAIYTGNYKYADQCLTQAEQILKGSESLDDLWVLKWRAALEAFTTGDVSVLKHARQEAQKKKQWESVRELDFISCRVSFDENLYARLFFGTQFAGYRRTLARYFDVPKSTQWTLPAVPMNGKKAAIDILNDLTGDLALGTPAHALLMLLISDSYRAMRVGWIHSHLFSDSHFDPNSSDERISKIAKKLESALPKQLPGMKLILKNGSYKLNMTNLKVPVAIPRDFPEAAILTKNQKKSS